MPGPQLDASVLLATYNQPQTTSLALRALFAQQTEHSYEVIVCDDGSRSAALEAVRNTLEDAPVPSYIVWEQDTGFRLAANRNNGIRLARGRILIFLDGDLLPEAGFVERHVNEHRHDKVIGVGTRMWRKPDALPPDLTDAEELWRLLRDEASSDRRSKLHETMEQLYRHYLWKLQTWMTCYGCNISVSNSPLVEFDESFEFWGNEDYDLFYNLVALQGYEVALIDAVAYDIEGKEKEWRQSDYIEHLRSGLQFFDKWEATGLSPEFAVPRYELDESTGLWRHAHVPVHGWSAGAPEYVDMVRQWLAGHEATA
jgi:glycosyltransferase involved in cell wall biosynthesis